MHPINYVKFSRFHFIRNIYYYVSTCFPACNIIINYRNEKQFISYGVYVVYGSLEERFVLSIPRTRRNVA